MRALDITGCIFGKLTAVEKTGESRDGSVLWKCVCGCGNDFLASVRHLNRKNNNVRSCGCELRKSGQGHPSWTGYEGISGKWWSSHLKHSGNYAKRKHIHLTLTKEEAWELFIEQDKKCYFTGDVLTLSDAHKDNTASLDRIDNSLGYSKDNVRWVHKHINMMRRTLTDTEFVKLCKKVSDKKGK